MTFEIINPEALGAPRGWNNGMLGPTGGRILLVAGQSAAGSDGSMPHGMAAQWERTLEKIVSVVRAAGGAPTDIGRLTIYVTDVEAYRTGLRDIGAAYRRVMGTHFPAMALLHVRGLLEPGALVEIEATAWITADAATES